MQHKQSGFFTPVDCAINMQHRLLWRAVVSTFLSPEPAWCGIIAATNIDCALRD